MLNNLKEFLQYKNMLNYYTRSELRSRYKGSILGVLWALLNPIILMIIYGFVFSVIVKNNIPNYYLFLFSGLLPWVFFRSALLSSANIIVSNAGLIKKIYFPREVLPISNVLSHLINFWIGLLTIIPVVIIIKHGVGFSILALPIIMLVQLTLTIGLALILSSLTVYFRDLRQMLDYIMMAGFYFTPIIYTAERVPEKIRFLYALNPLKPIIEAYQHIIYYKIMPNWLDVGFIFLVSIALLIFGYKLFNKLNKGFAEKV